MQSKDVSLASNFKQIKDDIFPARVLEDLNTYYYFFWSSSVYVVPHWLQ